MSATAVAAPTALDAALDAATHAFLNCVVREHDGHRFDGDELVLPLPAGELRVEVAHRSPAFRHRFVLPARVDGRPVALTTLAPLLLEALAAHDARGAGAPTRLLERLLDSVHAVEQALRERRDEVPRLWGPDPLTFAETEQALLLGHLTHPTPKSRGEMSPADRRRFSPETRGRFRLRWLSVAADVVRHASATGTPAPELVRALLPGASLDEPGRVLVPAHPWEVEHLKLDPVAGALFEDGVVVDRGEHGAPVAPTTSLRTVHGADWPWMLKFSLHVRVTNSMRVTLPKELDRAVEAARLARTDVGARARAVAPDFVLLQDPAYLAVAPGGEVVDGFSVLLRENRWPASNPADATALTTLCQDGPFGGPSRLAAVVTALAAREGRPVHDVGRAWFARFCEVVVVSLVRLHLDVGLCFEAHQQNTLLELEGGWPARGVYRDSQGYFHRELAHDDLCRVIPGLGEATESIFPEALADERLVYYLFVNQALGVVNALGVGGVADEAVLLADLRAVLERERARDTRYPATFLDRLLDDERWPCKGNLRTRVHDMDELVGDIATQSVYVSLPNPLR